MLVHEYCKYLVIETHIISYDYFCDKLQDWELLWLLQNMNYAYKNEWQMVRYQLYYTIARYTKTRYNSIEEFFPLSTDKTDNKEEHNTEITNDEIARLKKKAQAMEAMLNKQG